MAAVSNAVGYVLLALVVVVALMVTASPSWNAGRVQTVYHECLAAAQTPADARACGPSAPTPAPR